MSKLQQQADQWLLPSLWRQARVNEENWEHKLQKTTATRVDVPARHLASAAAVTPSAGASDIAYVLISALWLIMSKLQQQGDQWLLPSLWRQARVSEENWEHKLQKTIATRVDVPARHLASAAAVTPSAGASDIAYVLIERTVANHVKATATS